jgi:hypothetical protein
MAGETLTTPLLLVIVAVTFVQVGLIKLLEA